MNTLQQEVTRVLSHMQIKQEDSVEAIERKREAEKARAQINYQHQAISALSGAEASESPTNNTPSGVGKKTVQKQAPFKREIQKVGRNEPCPCGSGKKYKLCCGKIG